MTRKSSTATDRGIERLRYETDIPVKGLRAYRTNPHQRNTTARMAAAGATYLAKFEEPHREFIIAECAEDGQIYLIDGHTRTALWNSPSFPADQVPATFNALVYGAPLKTDVVRLYFMFNSPEAVKNKTDEVFGAMRQIGIEPASQQFVSASWLDIGLRALTGLSMGSLSPVKVDRGEAAASLVNHLVAWRAEIEAVDAIGFGRTFVETLADGSQSAHTYRRLLPVTMLLLALLMVRRDGERAIRFLTDIRDRTSGVRVGDEVNPVMLVMMWEGERKGEQALPPTVETANDRRNYDLLLMAYAYDAWCSDPATLLRERPRWNAATKKQLANFHPFARSEKAAAGKSRTGTLGAGTTDPAA